MAQTLRHYQIEAAQAVLNAIDPFGEGLNRVLYVSPTGSGKTTTFSEIVRLLVSDPSQKHNILVLAHRIELIEQAVQRITDHCKGVLKSWEVGSEANVWRASPRSRVIVGMVQTCCKPGRPTPEWKPTVIITDECFPAGTLVDGKPIENIQVGDMVNAYDHRTEKVVERQVVNVFRNPVKELVRVYLTDGRSIVCTPYHPFYSMWNGGITGQWSRTQYVRAVTLTNKHSVCTSVDGARVSVRFIGVKSVEVLEPGSDGTFGGLCTDGFVYNLEVEEHHNYFANGVLVHNCHHASAKANYQSIFARYGVPEGKCVLIGTTATAKRTDRASLYAVDEFNNPVILAGKKGAPAKPANPHQSVFEKLVYNYSVFDAVEDGWIVPPRGFVCKTDTNIDKVRTVAGEFVEKDLDKAVNTEPRTLQAISRWREVASDRPTLVFCVSVDHAKRAAALWKDAGYEAADVNGETDKDVRRKLFYDFKTGAVQVICNVGVATEGVDLPNCSCVVMLRPTKSWGLFMQCCGRGCRTLNGTLNGMEDASPEERKAAINASGKRDYIILDVVDITKQFDDLCTAPKILDLPCNLDLEGHTVAEAKKLIDDHREAKEIVTDSLPLTFTELAGRLVAVDLLRSSNAQSKKKWRVVDGATLRYEGTPAGYTATMHQQGDRWRLIVSHGTNSRLFDKVGRFGMDHFDGNESIAMTRYLDHASEYVHKAVDEHRIVAQSNVARGTLEKLTEKQRKCLQANGHTAAEIDKMPYGMAKNLIGKYMERWNKVMV